MSEYDWKVDAIPGVSPRWRFSRRPEAQVQETKATNRPVSDEYAAEIAKRTRPRPGTWDYAEHGTRDIDALLADRAWCGEQIAQLQGDEKDSDGFARNAEKIILAQAEQISMLRVMLESTREELYELRGERHWWKDEPRCGHADAYRELNVLINSTGEALANTAAAAAAYRESIEAPLRAQVKEIEQPAGNLLARMHHDGGHYISEHGWKKACEDAELTYLRLREEEKPSRCNCVLCIANRILKPEGT